MSNKLYYRPCEASVPCLNSRSGKGLFVYQNNHTHIHLPLTLSFILNSYPSSLSFYPTLNPKPLAYQLLGAVGRGVKSSENRVSGTRQINADWRRSLDLREFVIYPMRSEGSRRAKYLSLTEGR